MTTPASAPWQLETPTGFQSPYEPHEPYTRYESRHRQTSHKQGERDEPRAPYVPPITPQRAVPPPSRQPAAPAHRDAGFASTGPSATPEPAVLRSRDDNRRISPASDEPVFASDTPSPVRDSDDEEDVFGYREPYAPYRQDDLDDAEQQTRDMASRRDSRFPVYAHRDVVDDEEGPVYVPIPGEARTRYDDMTDAGMAPPIFMDEEVQRRRTLAGRLWLAGCLLGLIVLGLQWIYIYRTSIATAVPALRPVFETVCAELGCQVGYARRLERISITASSLQPQSGAAAGDGPMRLVLGVTMRNRYDKPQPWPALMLQLTDLSDTVVVRKVLLPENYLPPGTPGFFAAGAEQSISVPLQVAGPHVNGYQLDKFFP